MSDACLICAGPKAGNFGPRSAKAKYCLQCSLKREQFYSHVRATLQREIRRGAMKPASHFQCVDCGGQAVCYDHRDYNKPLDVDPVCDRCDSIRGPGKPTDELAAKYPWLMDPWRRKKAA